MSVRTPENQNPRGAAVSVLVRIRREGRHADQLIDQELVAGHLSGPDRGLFAELVFGVLRRQGTLDHVLSAFVSQSLERLEPVVLEVLRVGLYQLMYLDRIPPSAAVNEAVKLAKMICPRASGLINAVLRNYLRHPDRPVFPDQLTAPVASIAARHSQPAWLVSQWLEQVGATEAELLAEASSRQPLLTLRVNTLKTDRDTLLQMFEENGIAAKAGSFSPDAVLLEGNHQVAALPGFAAGLCAVQDEASQMAALLLAPQPGERVADTCAAPGGKATHLAQLMENRGEILAMDLAAAKLRRIEESAARLGITIIRVRAGNLREPDRTLDNSCDRVLLDAPCSGLGVIRRNPEAKWRLSPDDIKRLAETQKCLLDNAARMLKPGGTLLYSTCSTSCEENENIVAEFLSRHPEYVLEDLKTIFPGYAELFTADGMFRSWPHRHGMDGFFAARIRKK